MGHRERFWWSNVLISFELPLLGEQPFRLCLGRLASLPSPEEPVTAPLDIAALQGRVSVILWTCLVPDLQPDSSLNRPQRARDELWPEIRCNSHQENCRICWLSLMETWSAWVGVDVTSVGSKDREYEVVPGLKHCSRCTKGRL